MLTSRRLFVPMGFVCLIVLSAPAAGDRQLPGLRGQYFHDTGFSEPAFDRLDRQIDFDEDTFHLPESMDDGTFSVRWTGQLDVPRDGRYTLSAQADDELQLWLNGQLLLDTRDDAPVRILAATVDLQRGRMDLRVDYVNTGGRGAAQLRWTGPRIEEDRPIGIDQLRTAPWTGMPPYVVEALDRDQRGRTVDRVPGWRGRYYAGSRFEKLLADQRDRRILRLGRFPLPDGRTEDLSARWTGVLDVPRDGEYTFYTASDNGLRMWIDYRLVVDQWDDHSLDQRETRIRLQRGKHPILVEYHQGRGRSGISVAWSGPRLSKRPVGAEHVSTRPWPTMSEPRPFVILLALGHSNMQGRARSARKGPCRRAYFFDEGQWIPAAEPRKGPIWPLLHELTAAYPEVDFGVVKVARSAATLRGNFLPGKRSYREAIEQATAARRFGPIAAAIIMQGWVECERAGSVQQARQVGQDYPKLIRSLRKDLDRQDLPILASQIELGSDRKGKEDRWQAIHEQIGALDKKLDHLAVLPVKGLDMVDGHHFSRKGNEAWARLAAKALAGLGAFESLPADGRDDEPIVLPGPKADPDAVLAEVDAVVRRRTQGRSRQQLGTYRNLLVVTEYEVRKVRKGQLPGKRFLAVEFAIRKGKDGPARSIRKGQRRRLRLGSWRARKKLHSLPMDDDIMDFDAPLYYVLQAD